MKKLIPCLMGTAILLVILYMVGPKESVQDLRGAYPEVPENLTALESYVRNKEDTVAGLKPGNRATIVWADSTRKEKTPYSILYVHGFGASHMEGDPVHRKIAAHFGANLYLSRLPEHGISRPNAFEYLSASDLIQGAREAYMISRQLGEKVIVLGTSMGGALSLVLAEERPEIAAVLLYSPCIAIYGDRLDPLFQPWMKQLMQLTMTESGIMEVPREPEEGKYWADRLHINAYTSLAVLVKSKMNAETFEKVRQPLFMGYFYKNEEIQDRVVSVPAMLTMYEQLGTPEADKQKKTFPDAGDHVITSPIKTDQWASVLDASISFLEEVVNVPAREIPVPSGE
jgi:pimeloyl-ACP methyl ester carboxylesterase